MGAAAQVPRTALARRVCDLGGLNAEGKVLADDDVVVQEVGAMAWRS